MCLRCMTLIVADWVGPRRREGREVRQKLQGHMSPFTAKRGNLIQAPPDPDTPVVNCSNFLIALLRCPSRLRGSTPPSLRPIPRAGRCTRPTGSCSRRSARPRPGYLARQVQARADPGFHGRKIHLRQRHAARGDLGVFVTAVGRDRQRQGGEGLHQPPTAIFRKLRERISRDRVSLRVAPSATARRSGKCPCTTCSTVRRGLLPRLFEQLGIERFERVRGQQIGGEFV